MKESKDALPRSEGAIEIPFSECVRYLNSKNVTVNCAACGSDKGSIITEGDGKNVGMYASRAIRRDQAKVLEELGWGRAFFQTMCQSCGNMRQFDFGMIVDWLKDNPEEIP